MHFQRQLIVAVGLAVGAIAFSTAQATVLTISPGDTNPGQAPTVDGQPGSAPNPYFITQTTYGQHIVDYPDTGGSVPKPILVVFLGGTASTPGYYFDILMAAAESKATNFAAIELAYVDGGLYSTISAECNVPYPVPYSTDDCYTQARGESAFGQHVTYSAATGIGPYDASYYELQATLASLSTTPAIFASTSLGDSIVNRLVCLLDYLIWSSAGSQQSYWKSFLVADPDSPYASPHDPSGNVNYSWHVYPNWPRIILAGHSQGGSTAAFMAMRLKKTATQSSPGVRRVVLFSAPEDNLNQDKPITDTNPLTNPNLPNYPASWIKQPSQTPLSKFWGLRNASNYVSPGDSTPNNQAEGVYGQEVYNNWNYLGGTTSGGLVGATVVGGFGTSVSDGSAPPTNGSRALYLTLPTYQDAVSNHSSSAVNIYCCATTNPAPTWIWMFSGGQTDLGTNSPVN
jgi:hypothetical protein